MKVILAGFNVDTEVLAGLSPAKKKSLTPETISAAYARISRSPLSVDKLRKIAREEVAKARRSNRTIIFEMGHHSVAEHAVFNFDVIGVSRLVVEEIEKFRLCSYTEKSQRYVTMQGDFVLPAELNKSQFATRYRKLIETQNRCYQYLFGKLKKTILRHKRNLTATELRDLENRAKEDARYVLALATQTQLGMTINGRNLELMLRRFAGHPLDEVRDLGEAIFHKIKRVAPSIILFNQASDFEKKTYPELLQTVKRMTKPSRERVPEDVVLCSYPRDGDDRIIAALIHKASLNSFAACLNQVKKLKPYQKIDFLKSVLRHVQLYDDLLREFEYANLTFNLVVSASCFAQLKRHRLLTMTVQSYDPELGVMVPESIWRVNEQVRFRDVISQTNELYGKIVRQNPLAAQYILTNAHRRRVLISVNLRELYHMSRLREDTSAQWDIRQIVSRMTGMVSKAMPITCMLMAGKDQYPETYKRVFGYLPRVTRAELPGERKF